MTTTETKETPKCPKCGEPATHAEPLVLDGRQKAWCPNAHWFTVPAHPSTEGRA